MKISTEIITLVAAALASLFLRPASAGNFAFTYDPAGRLVPADYGSNRTASYAYDNAGNLLQSFTPSPGIIIGPIVGGQFTLSWPASPIGFTLQRATSIGSGATWVDAGLTPAQSGNLLVVTVPFSATTTFYRLRK